MPENIKASDTQTPLQMAASLYVVLCAWRLKRPKSMLNMSRINAPKPTQTQIECCDMSMIGYNNSIAYVERQLTAGRGRARARVASSYSFRQKTKAAALEHNVEAQ